MNNIHNVNVLDGALNSANNIKTKKLVVSHV